MNRLIDQACTEFTIQTASDSPAPGGGGVCALAASLGISLGHMVGALTVGKKKYASVEEEIRNLMDRAEKLRIRLLELVDEDAGNFKPLAAAYAIPKDDPHKDAEMEQCLRIAAQGPMEILENACKSVPVLKEFAEKGSKLVISDAATGASLARAAISGAAMNVKVNTKLMKDRAFAEEMNQRVDHLTSDYLQMADEVYQFVYEQFC